MKLAFSCPLVLACAYWTIDAKPATFDPLASTTKAKFTKAVAFSADTTAIAHAHMDFWNGLTDGSFIHAANVSISDEVNMRGAAVSGLQGLVDLRERYHAAFGDLTFHTKNSIVGPLNDKHEFLMSWDATATHTGDFNGVKPIVKGVANEYYGVNRLTVNKGGTKILKIEVMHGTFILEQIGLYNQLVVDTQVLGDKWVSFWNHETDDLSRIVTQDVKLVDNINMKGMNMDSAMTGIEGIKKMRALYKAAFSDMTFDKAEVTPLVGNRFILAVTVRATNDGELMGVPPTNKGFISSSANIITVEAGKISECQIIHGKHIWTELGLFKGVEKKNNAEGNIEL